MHDAWLLSWETGEGKIANRYWERGFTSSVFYTCFAWKYHDLTLPCEQRKIRTVPYVLSCHLVVYYGGHLTFDVIESDSEIFYAKSVFQTSIIYNPAY